MNKKYEMMMNDFKVLEDGVKVYRILSLRDFNNVKTGELGGYIEKEENLSHKGDCWVYDKACVFNDAHVFGNAYIHDNARIFGCARVYDDAFVFGCTVIYGSAEISDEACIFGNAQIFDDACVFGGSQVSGNVQIFGKAHVYDKTHVCDNAKIFGCAQIYNEMYIYRSMEISDNNQIFFVGNIGSRDGTTYFIYTNGNIFVRCGCFKDTIDKFENKVKNTYFDNDNIHRVNYLDAINYAKNVFSRRFPTMQV